MFAGITQQKWANFTEQELRWLDNVKKAFYESDLAYLDGRAPDRCFPELCNAIDTAKTLRRSLRGEDTSGIENKKRFVEFLNLHATLLPKMMFKLVDAHGKPVDYTVPEVVYAIRCMVHENENLNAAEKPNYHIVLNWTWDEPRYFGQVTGGRLVCNARELWGIVRRKLALFVTKIDAERTMALAIQNKTAGWISGYIGIAPPLCSIQKGHNGLVEQAGGGFEPPM